MFFTNTSYEGRYLEHDIVYRCTRAVKQSNSHLGDNVRMTKPVGIWSVYASTWPKTKAVIGVAAIMHSTHMPNENMYTFKRVMRGSKKFYRRRRSNSDKVFFLADEGRAWRGGPNTTKSGSSSVRQRNANDGPTLNAGSIAL